MFTLVFVAVYAEKVVKSRNQYAEYTTDKEELDQLIQSLYMIYFVAFGSIFTYYYASMRYTLKNFTSSQLKDMIFSINLLFSIELLSITVQILYSISI